jgi:hypothetical protein
MALFRQLNTASIDIWPRAGRSARAARCGVAGAALADDFDLLGAAHLRPPHWPNDGPDFLFGGQDDQWVDSGLPCADLVVDLGQPITDADGACFTSPRGPIELLEQAGDFS